MPTTFEHWRYFLVLADDLERTFRYVEPDDSNFKTHSVEFTRLYLSACSEVDVVAKLICKEIAPTETPENITAYRKLITEEYSYLQAVEVSIHPFNIAFKPWSKWSLASTANPEWWQDHQRVKHERNLHFKLANLENCLNAVAGLFCLNLYHYHEQLVGLGPSGAFSIRIPVGARAVQRYTLLDFHPPDARPDP